MKSFENRVEDSSAMSPVPAIETSQEEHSEGVTEFSEILLERATAIDQQAHVANKWLRKLARTQGDYHVKTGKDLPQSLRLEINQLFGAASLVKSAHALQMDIEKTIELFGIDKESLSPDDQQQLVHYSKVLSDAAVDFMNLPHPQQEIKLAELGLLEVKGLPKEKQDKIGKALGEVITEMIIKKTYRKVEAELNEVLKGKKMTENDLSNKKVQRLLESLFLQLCRPRWKYLSLVDSLALSSLATSLEGLPKPFFNALYEKLGAGGADAKVLSLFEDQSNDAPSRFYGKAG